MKLSERTRGDIVVIEVHGPLVRDEAEPLVLLAALRAGLARGHTCILLDVAEVSLVDSLWLGALLQGYTTAIQRGGTIKLLHTSRRFRELLAVTKLDRVLESFESEEAATVKRGA